MFQSAPSHGGRLSHFAYQLVHASFNPRPRTEGDSSAAIPCNVLFQFQSAPSHGGRLEQQNELLQSMQFQSAPSHGGRLQTLQNDTGMILGFNPRPRTEGDRRPVAIRVWAWPVSIRALARRATDKTMSWENSQFRFNPRPRTEGDTDNG